MRVASAGNRSWSCLHLARSGGGNSRFGSFSSYAEFRRLICTNITHTFTRYSKKKTKNGPAQRSSKDEAAHKEDRSDVHVPVLLEELVSAVEPHSGGVYVDATFGRGGHSRALLEKYDCRVVAVDCDSTAISGNEQQEIISKYRDRLITVKGRFGDLQALLKSVNVESVDGILADLGVSSPQLDNPGRGFSFRPQLDGPLDMRMDTEDGERITAEYVVNNFTEEQLANIIWKYGEERYSRQIADKIVYIRKKESIKTTNQLASIVRSAIRYKTSKQGKELPTEGIDAATRTFQALRIYINQEIEQLRRLLYSSELLLKPGGRLAVISFHSLEDREVKQFLQFCSGRKKHYPFSETPDQVFEASPTDEPSFLNDGAVITPTAEEAKSNPRARSAKLRVAERSHSPPLLNKYLHNNNTHRAK